MAMTSLAVPKEAVASSRKALGEGTLTSVRLASETASLRSMSVPSDLQRGREELLVVMLALIRWDAMFGLACCAPASAFRLLRWVILDRGFT